MCYRAHVSTAQVLCLTFTKVHEMEEDTQPFWRMTVLLRNKSVRIPNIHGENDLVYEVADKPEAFTDCMECKCNLNYEDADLYHVEEIEADVRHIDIDQPAGSIFDQPTRRNCEGTSPARTPGNPRTRRNLQLGSEVLATRSSGDSVQRFERHISSAPFSINMENRRRSH